MAEETRSLWKATEKKKKKQKQESHGWPNGNGCHMEGQRARPQQGRCLGWINEVFSYLLLEAYWLATKADKNNTHTQHTSLSCTSLRLLLSHFHFLVKKVMRVGANDTWRKPATFVMQDWGVTAKTEDLRRDHYSLLKKPPSAYPP